jgi:chaperonin GroEL (HSP60 family)
MEDLAAITGATYISDEKGRELKKVQMKDFGRAKKVVVSKNETSIISPKSNKAEIKNILEARDRSKSGPNAPSCGLYFLKTDY